jgi:hypothetical protein
MIAVGLSDELSDNPPGLGRTRRTPVDSHQPVDAVPAEAIRVPLCLRDEEAI